MPLIFKDTTPPQIDPEDLLADDALVGSAELKKIIDRMSAEQNWQPGSVKRFSDEDFKDENIHYSFLAEKESDGVYRIFIIYKGEREQKHLGIGEYGKVKIIGEHTLDANDSNKVVAEYYAYKLNKASTNPNQKEKLEHEAFMLKATEQLIASVSFDTTKKGKEKYGQVATAFIMEYAQGNTLNLLNLPGLNPILYMRMAQDVTNELGKTFHDKGIIHTDIKRQNIVYNPATRKATFIDVDTGMVIGNQDSVKGRARGTPQCVEPAIRNPMFNFMKIRDEITILEKQLNHNTENLTTVKKDLFTLTKRKENIEDDLRDFSLEIIQRHLNENQIKLDDLAAHISKLEDDWVSLTGKPKSKLGDLIVFLQDYVISFTINDNIKATEIKLNKISSYIEELNQKIEERKLALADTQLGLESIDLSRKTDIYELGIALAASFELIEHVQVSGSDNLSYLKVVEFNENAAHPILRDQEVRRDTIAFLKKMTSDSPQERPPHAEVSKFFNKMEMKLADNPDNKVKISLIDVSEFLKADVDKLSLLRELSKADEVQLTCTNDQISLDSIRYIAIMLRDYGLFVKPSYLDSQKEINDLIKQDSTSTYYPVTRVRQESPPQVRQRLSSISMFTKDVVPIKRKMIDSLPQFLNVADFGRYSRLVPPKLTAEIQYRLMAKLHSIQDKTTKRLTRKEMRTLFGIKPSHNMVVQRDGDNYRLFAIQRGGEKAIGKGSFGGIKLIQDQVSGELFAVKSLKDMSDNEINALKAMGEIVASYSYTPQSEKGIQKYAAKSDDLAPKASGIIMKLAPGMRLSTLYKNGIIQAMSPLEKLEMIIKIAEQIDKLHKLGFIHCDLKPDNIHYDPVTKEARLVDYGSALKNGAPFMSQGSDLYLAPEASNLAKPVTYTEKIDGFSFGVSLGECFGLLDAKNKTWSSNNTGLEEALFQQLKQLTNTNPEQRSDISHFLNNAIKLKESLKSNNVDSLKSNDQIKISVLNTNTYQNMSVKHQQELIKTLQEHKKENAGAVVKLISPDSAIDSFQIQLIKLELEQNGLHVDKEISYGANQSGLMRDIRNGLLGKTDVSVDLVGTGIALKTENVVANTSPSPTHHD